MNNAVQFIQTLIDGIESNLNQRINIEQQAHALNVTPWHFQRLFKALVGDSLYTYIMQRRLTTGAHLLNNTQLSIKDIAIELGLTTQDFNYHFQLCYQLTPQAFRLEQPEFKQTEHAIIDQSLLDHLGHGIFKHAKIEMRAPISLVGYQAKVPPPFVKSDTQSINHYPAWKQILKHQDQIEHRIKNEFFGLVCSESGNFDEAELDYLACVPVTKLGDYPSDAKVHHIPEQLVAMFDIHAANLNAKERTIDYIYACWLPNSGYERGLGDDYEVFENIIDFTNPNKLRSHYVIPLKQV